MTYLLIVFGYIIGSIPFALLVGKLGYKVDVREHGSGNLGGTNTFRTLGKKAGIMVTLGDILKGTLAASLPILFSLPVEPLWIGVAAVIGHCYPLFAKFKGGKAVATSGGVILFIDPNLFITMFIVFIIVLILSKMVSLSSMIGSIYASVYTYLFSEKTVFVFVLFLSLLILYRHRSNIKRIIKKEEPKVYLFGIKSKKKT